MSYSEQHIRKRAIDTIPRQLSHWLGTAVTLAETAVIDRIDLLMHSDTLAFAVEVRSRTDVASLAHAAKQAQAFANASTEKTVPIVVVPYMPESGRERLEEEGVSWIDLSGNARLHVNIHDIAVEGGRRDYHAHVWVEGHPNQFVRRGRPSNPFAPKASRITRYLLLHPGKSFSQRELAKATGLGEGYVSRLVRRLEDLDLIVRDKEGAVKGRDYKLLLDGWAEANAYRHSILTGHLPGRSGEEVAFRLAQLLKQCNIKHALTGLAAAAAYTHAAAFRSVSCYVRDPIPENELEAIGFRVESSAPNVRLLTPDDTGVFDGVREVDGFRCVAPVQAYIDLQHEPERAIELMNVLRQRYLEPD